MIIDEIQMWAASELGVSAEQFASFSLSSVDQSQSYILEQAVGLDPDQISPVFTGSWTEGSVKEQYFEMKLPPRNVALKIKLNPQLGSETYSSLRDHIYRLIARSRTGKVELRFMYNSAIVATLQGLVTKVESQLFDTDPKIQISLYCAEPLLKSASYISDIPNPTFPADFNWSITDNESTAPHGFKAKIVVGNYHLYSLAIQTVTGYDNLVFFIDKAFSPDDEIYISSEEGNKYLYFKRGSTITHLVDKVSPGSFWPMIFPGENTFFLDAPAEEELFGYTVYFESLTYKYHYWGV